MLSLHAPFVSFPIAFIVLLFALEGLVLWPIEAINFTPAQITATKRLLLVTAFLGAIVAFVTGLIESNSLSNLTPSKESAITLHYEIARLFCVALIPLTVFHEFSLKAPTIQSQRYASHLYRFVLVIAVGLVLFAGHLGGELVFRSGVGVQGN